MRTVIFAGVLGWLILSARTCVVWIAPGPTHGSAHLVPGTELASGEVPSISLSPNSRWLVYSEYSMPPPQVFDLPWYETYAVASVDLVTNNRTSYVDTLKCVRRPFDYKMIGVAGPASWQGEVFLLHECDNARHFVALRPGQAQLEPILRSEEPLTCSDCSPHTSPKQSIDWPRNLVNHWSVAVDGNSVYYVRDGVRTANALHAGEVVVVGKLSKKYLGMTTEFGQLRISPDQHYLAYCVSYSLNVPIVPGSGWVEYLYLRDLKSGLETRIAARSSLSNLVWSRDSRRLYFAGLDLPRWLQFEPLTGGIYVVDVQNAFLR